MHHFNHSAVLCWALLCVSDLLWRPKCAYLGVCFSLDSEISAKHNFEKRLLALEKCLNIWSSRDLTLNRKIYIVKNLALSKIVFIASVLSIPSGFVDQVGMLLASFVWNHKPPKIRHLTMIGKIKDGRYAWL